MDEGGLHESGQNDRNWERDKPECHLTVLCRVFFPFFCIFFSQKRFAFGGYCGPTKQGHGREDESRAAKVGAFIEGVDFGMALIAGVFSTSL